MKKFYAVKKGRKTGIFYSWNDCKQQVYNFSGAVYKSFDNLDDAKEFLRIKGQKINQNKDVIKVYVDGSYEDNIKEYGFGVLILKDEEILYKHSQKGNNKELLSMRNVAGEIEGAMFAMNYCIKNNIFEIDLYFDYEGIEKWCSGEWNANKIGTKNYKNFYENIKDKLKINFIKVKSHSGDFYNDYVDKLAKESLGI